jgi:hypothetical protein
MHFRSPLILRLSFAGDGMDSIFLLSVLHCAWCLCPVACARANSYARAAKAGGARSA